jgi:hypothetical protein
MLEQQRQISESFTEEEFIRLGFQKLEFGGNSAFKRRDEYYLVKLDGDKYLIDLHFGHSSGPVLGEDGLPEILSFDELEFQGGLVSHESKSRDILMTSPDRFSIWEFE